MAAGLVKDLQKSSFWLALLLHLLILLFLSYLWVSQPEHKQENIEQTYIPSFAYQEPPPAASHKGRKANKEPTKDATQAKKQVPVSKDGIEKPVVTQRNIQFNEVMDISSPKNSEPVHLIGDKSKTPQPLIIILGKALTEKLLYPKAAIDLTIKGVSVIGFILYPDGTVSDVKLLKSSSADVLDQAALIAAREISPVKNVKDYVHEATPIVFGIIFGSR